MNLYLYDSSAILNLLKRGEIRVFYRGHTLDLALYETMNAIWKEYYLLKKIQLDTVYKLIDIISKVFNVLEIHNITGSEKEVFNIAIKEGLTIYDASYIYVAVSRNLTLVTDDSKLGSVARKYIKTKRSADILI